MATATITPTDDRRVIDLGYSPHEYQAEIHEAMQHKRFGVFVCHRRFGKTVAAIFSLAFAALLAQRENARFAYIAPYLKQAKSISWLYLSQIAARVPGTEVNKSELWIQFANGARITLYGADNEHAIRGQYFDGVVLDEPAQMQLRVIWQEVVLPALADRQGWAIFIGTPRGVDNFYDIFTTAQKNSADWFTCVYRADETNLPWLPEDELNLARRTMSDAQFRQEYLCDFSASSDDALITLDIISAACHRPAPTAEGLFGTPRIIGADIARFGDDSTVLQKRWGVFAFDPIIMSGSDNMQVVGRLAREIDEWKPDAVFIDGGRGEGVIDRLRQLGYTVTEVQFGSTASDKAHYNNKRTEMWCVMAEWLADKGVIPNDSDLKSELAAPTYAFNPNNQMALEKKDDIKERVGRSPDRADALALTFAFPVQPKQRPFEEESIANRKRHQKREYVLPWQRKENSHVRR